MKSAFLALVTLLVLAPSAARAADAPRGEAAFLFAYHPKEGQQEQFDAGYRKHLNWHRDHGDTLPWYGWYVSSGDRIGTFVDGTFGIPFEAFDHRVLPAEDGANFASTTAPWGDTAWRKVLRLMPRLGTATRLEDREPSPAIEVVTHFVKPGKTALFESCLEQLVAAVDGSAAFTVYRQLSGGAEPAYVVMFPRDDFGWFGEYSASLEVLIRAHLDAEAERKLLDLLSQSVRRSQAETWQYREDLSYLPE